MQYHVETLMLLGCSTVQHMTAAQNPEGGIGGGHGYQSHIAPTYAGVLSLAILGDKALECIDRRGMYELAICLRTLHSPLAGGDGWAS